MRTFLITSLVPFALIGCGTEELSPPGDVDAGLATDAADGCDVTAALPQQWRPIATVSTGAVTATTSGGVTSATIDATAGGLAGAPDNPYVYVDLTTGTRVDVSDVASRSSNTWHVAFKRSSIKVNGGDSGPSDVGAAKVAAATLAEVTTPPAAFVTDDWATEDCMLQALPGGEPATAMGDWYDYDGATHALSPKPEVWVIKAGVTMRKLRILTYYGDAAAPMRGAMYRVEWANL